MHRCSRIYIDAELFVSVWNHFRDSLLVLLGLQCGRPFRLASVPHRFIRVPGEVCNTDFRLLAGGPGLGTLWPSGVLGSASAGQGGGFGLGLAWLCLAQVTVVSGLPAADLKKST